MNQATTLVSVPDELRMVNEVPAVRAEIRRNPGVPPGVWQLTKIRLHYEVHREQVDS